MFRRHGPRDDHTDPLESSRASGKEHQLLAVGNDAPDFAANNQDGNIVRLKDFEGKWIAMWWYPKASTPG